MNTSLCPANTWCFHTSLKHKNVVFSCICLHKVNFCKYLFHFLELHFVFPGIWILRGTKLLQGAPVFNPLIHDLLSFIDKCRFLLFNKALQSDLCDLLCRACGWRLLLGWCTWAGLWAGRLPPHLTSPLCPTSPTFAMGLGAWLPAAGCSEMVISCMSLGFVGLPGCVFLGAALLLFLMLGSLWPVTGRVGGYLLLCQGSCLVTAVSASVKSGCSWNALLIKGGVQCGGYGKCVLI